MRRYILTAMTALFAFGLLTSQGKEQKLSLANDSIARAARLKSLATQREKLTLEIRQADAERNRKIQGVAPETMEAINDRQDSICMDLRSRLTVVSLEIKELSPTPHISTNSIMQYINSNRTDTIKPPTQK